MKNRLNGIILAIALAAYATVANATPISSTDTLANLAMGGSIAVGDKTFTNFSYLPSGLTGFDASQITVTASIQNGIYFLSYKGDISLVTTSTATADLVLNYRVTAAAGLIDYIDQRYTGNAQGQPGFLAVDETVNAGGATLANSHLNATDIFDFPGFEEVGDNLYVTPGQPFLNVTKDIAFGIVGPGSIKLSLVEQSFHQNVPDGGTTIGLLGGALIFLQVLRRKFTA